MSMREIVLLTLDATEREAQDFGFALEPTTPNVAEILDVIADIVIDPAETVTRRARALEVIISLQAVLVQRPSLSETVHKIIWVVEFAIDDCEHEVAGRARYARKVLERRGNGTVPSHKRVSSH